jgi:hypothetical protein
MLLACVTPCRIGTSREGLVRHRREMGYLLGLLGVLFVEWMGLRFVAELKVEKKYDRLGFVAAVLAYCGILSTEFTMRRFA